MSNNAEVLANDFYAMDNWGFFRNCYYSTKGGNYTPIQDWVKTQNTDTYNWMDENMRHDYIGIDLKTLEEYPVTNGWLTGSAVANPDMSIISLWVYTTWQSEELPYFNSYMLPIKSEITGVKRIADTTSQLSVTTGKGGVINISGDASSATVLDINGRVLYNASNPASTIATGIENGFYLVKVTDREGNTVVKKVNF